MGAETAGQPSVVQRIANGVCEAASATFWLYAITKLFFFDVDRAVLQLVAPQYEWLLHLKLLAFLILLSGTLIVLGRKRGIIVIVYIVLYPLVIILWRIPYFIWKQKSWIIAFSFINFLISFFASFGRSLIMTTIYASAFSTIVFAKDKWTILAAIVTVFAALGYTYISKFVGVFKSAPSFRIYKRIIEFVRDRVDNQTRLADDLRVPMALLDSDQLEKWRNGLYQSVLQNRCYLFAARRLRDYQNSGLGVATEIISTIFLLCITVTMFAVINLGLSKADHGSFITTVPPDLFHFLYYSFNTFVMSSIAEITAADVFSQTVSMAERFFALLLVVFFVSLLISIKSQRSSKEVDELIQILDQQGRAKEVMISTDYKLNTIKEAIDTLEKLKAGTASLLVFLSGHLDRF